MSSSCAIADIVFADGFFFIVFYVFRFLVLRQPFAFLERLTDIGTTLILLDDVTSFPPVFVFIWSTSLPSITLFPYFLAANRLALLRADLR